MSWEIISIGCGVYIVIVVGSILIAEYVVRNGFLVHLISALISLAVLITFLLLRLFGDLNVFWKDLAISLVIYSSLAIIIEIIYLIRARRQEKRIALYWKALEPSPEFKKHLNEMKEELEDPNRPHAHD